MKRIEDKNWKDFYLLEFFHCVKGNQNNMASLLPGNVPLVSAKKCDNGYKGFVSSDGKKYFEGGIITLNNDGDGGAGIAYYQPYKMALDSHVTALIPKRTMSRHLLLFVAMCITKQRDRFGHGYSLNSNRLRSFKLMLPLDETGFVPDWQFMEEYMKQKEQNILKPTIDRLCKQLIINNILGGGKCIHSNWKEFVFGEQFSIHATSSGIDKNKLNFKEGTIPYITRSDLNNGMDIFVTEQSSKYQVDEGNVITIGLDTQTVFYQPTSFYTGQNIQIIRHSQLDRYNALFLIVAIKKLVEKFSWGSYGATLTRLRKSRIYLPATATGEIDFAFMSAFMKDVEYNILNSTLRIFKDRIIVNKSKLGGVNWKNFLMRDVFPTLVQGKSKGLNHIQKTDNGISYLGATNQNNGVLCFVNSIDSLIQKGNCIAFIRNGEGSMGYSVYKAENFIATSDMTLGYNKHMNRYTGTFITTIADRVRGKYNFGYKRSATRLSKEIISLPVDNDGDPDWEYMEIYMRNIESKQILQYLQSIRTKLQ